MSPQSTHTSCGVSWTPNGNVETQANATPSWRPWSKTWSILKSGCGQQIHWGSRSQHWRPWRTSNTTWTTTSECHAKRGIIPVVRKATVICASEATDARRPGSVASAADFHAGSTPSPRNRDPEITCADCVMSVWNRPSFLRQTNPICRTVSWIVIARKDGRFCDVNWQLILYLSFHSLLVWHCLPWCFLLMLF